MPLKILLAEDNLVVRQMMIDFLSGEGHEVEGAASGDAAWDRLQSGKAYDVLLLDLCLPGMDGLELLKRMHTEPCPVQPSVVILSADHAPETKEAVMAAGATAFWPKPLTPSELISRVGALEQSRNPSDAGGILQERVLQELVQALGRDRKLARMIDTFTESLRDYERRIHQAAKHGDGQEVRNLLHGLKGAAGMFGASSLADWCQRQEALARQGENLRDGFMERELGALIEQTCKALEAFIEREGL